MSTSFEIHRVLWQADGKVDKALLQYSKICALPSPEPYDMHTLRKWLRNERGANTKVRGGHNLPHTWGSISVDPDKELGTLWTQFGRMLLGLIWKPNTPGDDLDLAITKPQTKIDGFTRWVVCDLIRFYKEFRKHQKEQKAMMRPADEEQAASSSGGCFGTYQEKRRRKKENKKKKKEQEKANDGEASQASVSPVDKIKKKETLETWGEKTPLRITSGISTVVACLLPVIAISVLSQLQGLQNLLLCLAGFAVIFALGLIFLTQGTSSRTEIFAATAA